MKVLPSLYSITAIIVFLQLLLGGLLTYNFISPEPHIVLGFVVFILAIATMIVALISKPSFGPIRIVSILIVVLILVQIILGFATLNNGNQAVAWLHFVNALAIYGATISGVFIALRWDKMAKARSTINSGTRNGLGSKT